MVVIGYDKCISHLTTAPRT